MVSAGHCFACASFVCLDGNVLCTAYWLTLGLVGRTHSAVVDPSQLPDFLGGTHVYGDAADGFLNNSLGPWHAENA